MKVVAVSQRVDVCGESLERRDALDQNIIRFLFSCGFIAVPIPNLFKMAISTDQNSEYFGYFTKKIKPHAFVLSGGPNIGDFPERDKTELAIMTYAEKRKLPLLGICRGMQMMAFKDGINPSSVVGHVGIRHNLYGEICGETNSYHNFGVPECPESYRVIARSNDKTIEAIRHKSLPWEGWMWHPEREVAFAKRDKERLKLLFSK